MSHLTLVASMFVMLAGTAAGAVPQDPVPVVLADEVDTPGVQESVDVSYAEDCRLLVWFSAPGSAGGPTNRVDIEASVDGGETWALLINDDELDSLRDLWTFSGPLTHVRAEVEELGPESTVTVKGLCTVR